MLQLVTVPIAVGLTNPDILGTLSVGFLLDDALAAQLKPSRAARSRSGWTAGFWPRRFRASDRPALGGLVLPRRSARTNVTLGTGEYAALPLALSPGDGCRAVQAPAPSR